MRNFMFIAVLLLAATTTQADEVLPALSKEDMSTYKSAFGQAIAESKRERERPSSDKNPGEGPKKDPFGAEVSKAAQEMKEDVLKTNKNFGGWVSKQRRSEKAESHSRRHENSAEVRASSPGGRPAGSGKPESAGKPNHSEHSNKGNGKGP